MGHSSIKSLYKSLSPKFMKKIIRENRVKFIKRNYIDNYIVGKHLRHVLLSRDIDLVIDVGANGGQFARLLRSKAGYKGPILSFEPQPHMFSQIQEQAKKDPDWKVFNLGIGSSASVLTLNVMRSNVFSSFLQPKDGLLSDLNEVVETVEVPVARLDEHLKSLNVKYRNILLKTDTQGYDLEVIKGAEGILDDVQAIVAELSFVQIYEGAPRHTDMMSCFTAMNFTMSGLYPVSLSHGQAIECDCIMVKAKESAVKDHMPYIDVLV